ncbi:YqzE family protein [Lentibacillus sp. CBA3610]|uniref:YqzE family protein n=1 Tax=Lentibacillus sp. CBA3610 TaxID=2518176 RepID=UPI00159529D4|nr:YqzE family protein [Lentibacillus sp. CBA3610]QKY69316.1 YqzE family protein [Lentibacillus sp. CBA3610]
MSFDDYVKYLTQQITAYLDTPAEEKRKQRLKNKQEPPLYSNRWLGVLPFAFKVSRKNTN